MNRPSLRTLAAGVTLIAAFCVTPRTVSAEKMEDSVVLESGQSFDKVLVTVETYQRVVCTGSGMTQELTYDKIRRIDHGDEPAAYKRGLSRMQAGEYQEAIDSFTSAREDKKVRDWIHPYSMFQIAECHRLAERYDKAIAAYEALLKQFPNNVFLPRAEEMIGDCYLSMRPEQYEKAQEVFGKLNRFGEIWLLRSFLGEARALEAKKDSAGAERKYREVISKVGQARDASFMKVLNACYNGVTRCLIAQDKADVAKRELDQFRRYCLQTRNLEGLAVAFNGQGDCERKMGSYETAILSYLRASILYGQDADEEDARALFSAAQCYGQLDKTAELPKNEGYKKNEWKKRCHELYKEVAGKYGWTSYGKKAKQMLPTS